MSRRKDRGDPFDEDEDDLMEGQDARAGQPRYKVQALDEDDENEIIDEVRDYEDEEAALAEGRALLEAELAAAAHQARIDAAVWGAQQERDRAEGQQLLNLIHAAPRAQKRRRERSPGGEIQQEVNEAAAGIDARQARMLGIELKYFDTIIAVYAGVAPNIQIAGPSVMIEGQAAVPAYPLNPLLAPTNEQRVAPVTTPAPITYCNVLFAPTQGTGSCQRIGRQAVIKKIICDVEVTLDGYLAQSIQSTVGQVPPYLSGPKGYYVALVMDTQSNVTGAGAAPLLTDMFNFQSQDVAGIAIGSGVRGSMVMPNLANERRFKILAEKRGILYPSNVNVGWYTILTGGTTSQTSFYAQAGPAATRFKLEYKNDIVVNFHASQAAATWIGTGMSGGAGSAMSTLTNNAIYFVALNDRNDTLENVAVVTLQVSAYNRVRFVG